MSERVLLLVNTYARRGDAKLQVQQQLKALGFELITDAADHSRDFAAAIRQYRDRVDLVVVGGGDGSVNAAIEGLLETGLPLGVVPLGTANNLARTLGIPQSIEAACNTIAQGQPQQIDLGWVNGIYFFNVAGIGLSANVNRQVDKRFKRRWGVIAYIVTALRLVFKQRRIRAEIRWQGKAIQVRTYQITVCNGRYYGSGLTVAADAAIDDQRLDLCSLEIQHGWQVVFLPAALMRGEYANGRGIRTLSGEEIEIRTRKPYPIDTDGEIKTETPAIFRVVPKAIAVMMLGN